jgi:mono/diheme cytochrome c family protein
MKSAVAALAASLLLLVASLALAQKEGKPKSSAKEKQDSPYEELTQVPEAARGRANPLVNDPEAVAAGRKLYTRHCAECHGANAEGGRKAPTLRVPEVQNATAGALFWVMTNGAVRSGMPVWSKLPEPQRWQIVTYVKTLGPGEPPASR